MAALAPCAPITRFGGGNVPQRHMGVTVLGCEMLLRRGRGPFVTEERRRQDYDTLTVTPPLNAESCSCSDLMVSPVASRKGTVAWIVTPGFTVERAESLPGM